MNAARERAGAGFRIAPILQCFPLSWPGENNVPIAQIDEPDAALRLDRIICLRSLARDGQRHMPFFEGGCEVDVESCPRIDEDARIGRDEYRAGRVNKTDPNQRQGKKARKEEYPHNSNSAPRNEPKQDWLLIANLRLLR